MISSEQIEVFSPAAFAGRVFGVTGAAHGIGQATALALARLGGRVLVLDVHEENLRRTSDALTALGGEFDAAKADVTDDARMTQVIDRAVERWGRLDGWVNNAYYGQLAPALQQPEAEFQRAWEVNCLAAWRIARRICPLLAKQSGAIVNISSIMAHQTSVGYASYTSSKAALEGLTRSLALEFAAQRVRVNAILPGYILSHQGFNDLSLEDQEHWPAPARAARQWLEDMHDVAQPSIDRGLPRDIADAVLFLLSPGSRFITGTTLTVDGGLGIDLRDLTDARRGEAYKRYCQLKPDLDAFAAQQQTPRPPQPNAAPSPRQ